MIALAAALALQACAPLEQVDAFGEVGFDTPVTAAMIGTALRGRCNDPQATCRLRDRTGVNYEVAHGSIVSKSIGGWGAHLPFGMNREHRLPDDALIAAGIDSAAIEIMIASRLSNNRIKVAVCDRPLVLTIALNEAGRARGVVLVSADQI